MIIQKMNENTKNEMRACARARARVCVCV